MNDILVTGCRLIALFLIGATASVRAADTDWTFLYTKDLHHFVKPEPEAPLIIKGGTLIDGTGSAPRANPGILLRDGRIELDLSTAPAGTREVDAAGKWILPGLLDAHAHVTYFWPSGWNVEDDVMNAVRAIRMMENYQKIGVTTIIDVGARNNVAFSLKRAQRMGLVGGSRMYVSGPVITTPGGHATEFPSPYEHTPWAVVATGPWEFRNRVREAVRLGADLIKVTPPYTEEELSATVEEARYWRIPVTAHVGGVPDLPLVSGRIAANAGVASVHHLYPYGKDSKETIKQMASKGIYVIPTIGYHLRELQGKAHVTGNWMEINLGHTYDNVLSLFRQMQDGGLKFAVGTDSNAEDILKLDQVYLAELEGLAFGGLSRMQVIQAATLHVADAFGLSDQAGSIEQGKWADVTIVPADPLSSLKALVAPELVIQAGRIVHDRRQ
jgi:imidazolonepropionase-like amidohydrolase